MFGDRIAVVLRRLWTVLAGMVVGVAVGVTLLSITDPAYLKPVVGIILLSICALMWFAPKLAVPTQLETVASPAAGVVGGLAGGLAALPGPFVFVYLLALGLKRDQFVQYSSMFLVISATVMTAFLLGRGVMGWSKCWSEFIRRPRPCSIARRRMSALCMVESKDITIFCEVAVPSCPSSTNRVARRP